MTRILLRALNSPTLILLAIIGVALQTSLFSFWPIQFLQPDVVLLAVVWCALRRGFTEGGVIALIMANVSEIHSAAPQGLFLIAYMTVYLAIRGLSRILVIPNLNSYVYVTLFASILWKLTCLFVLQMLGTSANQWRHTLIYLFPGAVVEGVLGIWVYRWLERLDWWTFKRPHDEDATIAELQLEAEGF